MRFTSLYRRGLAAMVCSAALFGCATTGGGSGGSSGGALLDGLDNITCLPTTATFECFEGKFIVLAAADPTKIGSFPPPPTPDREPATILYEDPGLDFSGGVERKEIDSAPIDIAGSRLAAPEMETYLNGLLAKLLAGSPKPAPPMKVFVVGNPFYSANAYPSGDIFVNIGLLHDAQNEDEVAAMLAHESSHVLLDHFDREELLARQEDLAEAITIGAALATRSDTSGAAAGGGLGGDLGLNAGNRTMYAVQATTFVAQDVIGTAWQRRQEDEADLLGLDLLISAGYNVQGSLTNFQRLAQAAKEKVQEMDRMEQRESQFQQDVAANPSLAGLLGAAQSAMGDALESGLKDARDWFRREHLDPEKRRSEVSGYFRREYPGPRPDLTSDPFLRAKKRARITEIYDSYKRVADAKSAFTLGSPSEALTTLEPALRGSVARDPYPRVLQAQILKQLGRNDQALAALGQIRKGASLSLDGYITKASLQAQTGDPDQAIATLDQGARLYGVRHFYPARLTALQAKGDMAEFERVYKACRALDERAIRIACLDERKRLGVAGDTTGDELRDNAVLGAVESGAEGLGGLVGGLFGGDDDAPATAPEEASAPAAE